MLKRPMAQVIEQSSGQILFECSIERLEEAYAFAVRMEEMDVDVSVVTPSLALTLAMELGSDQDKLQQIKDELLEEIESHPSEELCLLGQSSPNT